MQAWLINGIISGLIGVAFGATILNDGIYKTGRLKPIDSVLVVKVGELVPNLPSLL